MANCNYHLMNDGFDMIEEKLSDLASKIETLELNLDIDSLDVDLDNIELQLNIANKLHFLDAVGIDVMTEEEQAAAYMDIKDLLFSPSGSTEEMQDAEGD